MSNRIYLFDMDGTLTKSRNVCYEYISNVMTNFIANNKGNERIYGGIFKAT